MCEKMRIGLHPKNARNLSRWVAVALLDHMPLPSNNNTMGINGLLPRILPSAGRENYDLRALKDGIVSLTHHEQQQPPSKRRRRTRHDTTTTTSKGWTRRKVRIAVDVNGWISRAAHGYGGTLMDERHLSYHGRAQLRNQQLEDSGEEKEEDGENNDETIANNNNYNQQQQQQQQQLQQDQIQAQQRLEYIQFINRRFYGIEW